MLARRVLKARRVHRVRRGRLRLRTLLKCKFLVRKHYGYFYKRNP